MTWYLLYAKANHELPVATEIEALGIEVQCARRLLKKRTGRTKRDVVFFDAPYLPNFIFAQIPAAQYLDVMGIKGLASTAVVVSDREMTNVSEFMASALAEYEHADRTRENLDAIAEYEPGQALRLLNGRYADMALTFRKMVERSHDPFPKVVMAAEMFGREVLVEADPLEVSAANG